MEPGLKVKPFCNGKVLAPIKYMYEVTKKKNSP
jgi:hypothetical protein